MYRSWASADAIPRSRPLACKALERIILLPLRSSLSGGILCRPLSAPAQESEKRWGKVTPPGLATATPRPFSGVAHAPHVGVDDVLGRVPDAGEIESRDGHSFRRIRWSEMECEIERF